MAQRPIITAGHLVKTLAAMGQESVSKQITEGTQAADGNDVAAAAQQMAFQRALQEIAKAETGDGVLTTPQHAMASALQSYLSERSVDINKTVPLAAGGEEAVYDPDDLGGWIKSFFTWWRGIVPQDWLPAPTEGYWIPNQLRIGVVADWGTGLYGAPVCAASMDADTTGYDVYLHLGDVYYSGTQSEEKRFIKDWPKKARRFNLALNSNHEMYTGGDGLFKVTLPAFNQKSTCFWLQNDHFALVGLDTAYKEHDLTQGQPQWVQGIVDQAQARRVILFSHHQPFSQLEENQGDKLKDALRPLLETGKIFAWYWGHEHRLAVYDRHPDWGLRGRCIGHGGMPYFRDREPGMGGNQPALYKVAKRADVPAALILDGPNKYINPSGEKYGPNGYMTLEFDGPRLAEHFHLPDSTKLLSQELAADGSIRVI